MVQYRFRTRTVSLALIGLASCIGTVDAPDQYSGDFGSANGTDEGAKTQQPVDTDGDGIPDSPPPGSDGEGEPGTPNGGDGDEPGGDGDGNDAGYRFATVGSRCSGGKRTRFVVV